MRALGAALCACRSCPNGERLTGGEEREEAKLLSSAVKRLCRWWLNGLRCCIIDINRALSLHWQLLIQQENSNKYRCGGCELNACGGVIHGGEERGTWAASMALPRSEERVVACPIPAVLHHGLVPPPRVGVVADLLVPGLAPAASAASFNAVLL